MLPELPESVEDGKYSPLKYLNGINTIQAFVSQCDTKICTTGKQNKK